LLAGAQAETTKHDYQSDVARMRKIVVNSLYSHREIFLRELISNSNDALEKLRLVSLTDKNIIDSSAPLNISIKAIKDEDGEGGKLVITDTGIGMSADEMITNLGTLAKSGTSEFISKAKWGRQRKPHWCIWPRILQQFPGCRRSSGCLYSTKIFEQPQSRAIHFHLQSRREQL